MSRCASVVILLAALTFALGCTNKKVKNPLADLGSKQPDKVLFDRAMDAMKHNKFDVSRMILQTLINTYPDSEYIARAKLGVADSWYAEGGTAGMAQAENEYNDFRTFFPNMPEAAEAQLKIANIHYQQMEKPDRDFTHAMRAEDEYRNLIMQYPDSKLLPEAKKRLLQVQEVLAEREFRIGRFYYYRQSYPAAMARLETLVDRYPLYSGADEALFLLGQSYEQEIALIRGQKIQETAKAQYIQKFADQAAAAYARILKRYPVMPRAGDAKERLEALKRPVPKPTKAAVAQNRAEEESRRETGTIAKVMSGFRKHPDVSQASSVGDPTLTDPKTVSATDVVQDALGLKTAGGESGNNTATIETVKEGAPPENQPIPRADASVEVANPTGTDSTPPAAASSNELTPNTQPAAEANDANELKPNVDGTSGAGELKPNVDQGEAALPPPGQTNQIDAGSAGQTGNKAAAATSSDQDEADVTYSSSKHKKKKGLRKIVPF